jgi:hypothetical protein
MYIPVAENTKMKYAGTHEDTETKALHKDHKQWLQKTN